MLVIVNLRFPYLLFALASLLQAHAQFDLVVLNGRVMDPESDLDARRNLGIRNGLIATITKQDIAGKKTINAEGLVVAPGFIDLHQHAQDPQSYRFKALDGVTTALELEVGAADVDAWYAARSGKLPINHGVSIGHMKVRMTIMGDTPSFLPGAKSGAATRVADEEQLAALRQGIRKGLDRGAVAVGFGIAYTPMADRTEIFEMFKVAAEYGASCHVHMRTGGHQEPGGVAGLQELIANAAITGAPLHIVHIQSTGKRVTPILLQMVSGAQARGLDLTAECYPYTAGMTDIRAAFFEPGWREKFGLDYHHMQWGATGERLTEATFRKYRKKGGLVIVHTNPESIVRGAVADPSTIIASDGLNGHPRNAGTFCRILGHYVRETKSLTLMQALRKITLMPARRLEKRVPSMRNKGRIRTGSDADLTLFDPNTVTDKATFTDALQASFGVQHLIAGGKLVVHGGVFQEQRNAGNPIRAEMRFPTELP